MENKALQYPLLDPKNDYVFKRLFVDAPYLLAELINAVRSDEIPIASLEVLNPKIDPEDLTGKYIILDLLAKDASGKHYNIEMQVRRYNAWSARSAFYLARMLTQQLDRGESYTRLKPAIGIHLLDFDLFQGENQKNQAVWCFEMRDKVQPEVRLGKELQLNLIELRKADRLGLSSEALKAWITFFEHWQEELKMAEIAYEPVQDAMQRIKDLSADQETQHLAFVRERALHDEASLLQDAEDKGREEGREEGKEEGLTIGRTEGEASLLARLLIKRFGDLPDWAQIQLQEASPKQLEQWADNILFADSVKAVFQAD